MAGKTLSIVGYEYLIKRLKEYGAVREDFKVLEKYFKENPRLSKRYYQATANKILEYGSDVDLKVRISPSLFFLNAERRKIITLSDSEREYLQSVYSQYENIHLKEGDEARERFLAIHSILGVCNRYPEEREIYHSFNAYIKKIYIDAYLKFRNGIRKIIYKPSEFIKSKEYAEAMQKETQAKENVEKISKLKKESKIKNTLEIQQRERRRYMLKIEKKEQEIYNLKLQKDVYIVEKKPVTFINQKIEKAEKVLNNLKEKLAKVMSAKIEIEDKRENSPDSIYKGAGMKVYDNKFFDYIKEYGVGRAEAKNILDKFVFLIKNKLTQEDARDYLDVFDRHSIKSDNGAEYRRATTM